MTTLLTGAAVACVVGWLAIWLWRKHGDRRKIAEFYAILLALLAIVAAAVLLLDVVREM